MEKSKLIRTGIFFTFVIGVLVYQFAYLESNYAYLALDHKQMAVSYDEGDYHYFDIKTCKPKKRTSVFRHGLQREVLFDLKRNQLLEIFESGEELRLSSINDSVKDAIVLEPNLGYPLDLRKSSIFFSLGPRVIQLFFSGDIIKKTDFLSIKGANIARFKISPDENYFFVAQGDRVSLYSYWSKRLIKSYNLNQKIPEQRKIFQGFANDNRSLIYANYGEKGDWASPFIKWYILNMVTGKVVSVKLPQRTTTHHRDLFFANLYNKVVHFNFDNLLTVYDLFTGKVICKHLRPKA